MKIELENVGKRYQNEWILKNINLQLNENGRYAITGPNGSGKSTFLKIISGHLTPSKGKVKHWEDDRLMDIGTVYKQVSYAAPYIDLIEELTLKEAIQFHINFKPLLEGLKLQDLIEILDLKRVRNKQIRYFSSGMKQRLKLAMAICSQAGMLLLDEPTTNLDRQGIEWYLKLIERFGENRLLIIASNVQEDYQFCKDIIQITDYK